MKHLTLISVILLALTVDVAVAADRKCTDAHGVVLYIVTDSGRVTDAHGTTLGYIRPNGDVYDARNALVAHQGDAGLLIRR